MFHKLQKQDPIFLAGHNGLLGRSLRQKLLVAGYTQLIVSNRTDLDLRDAHKVNAFISRHRPTAIIIAAARVGGIKANHEKRVEFLMDNLLIATNLLMAAHSYGTKLVVNFGSSCIYPRDCPQPMEENYLLSGPLEITNRPYAIAKIAAAELVNALNMQYGHRYVTLMPTNLYGPGDNFDLETSHVVPALIRRFHEAKVQGAQSIKLWGSGRALREFLYVDDCSEASIMICSSLDEQFFQKTLNSAEKFFHINLGLGEELTIKECAQTIAKVVGYRGEIQFDGSVSDGTPRKRLRCDYLASLGWKPTVSFKEGIERTYRWYCKSL